MAGEQARRFAAIALATAGLAACNLAPKYQPPVVTAPIAYKDAGPWTAAQPADSVPRGAWWTVFGDAQLDLLEARIDLANPTLAAALAAYDQARAFAAAGAAAQYPTISLSGSPTTNRQSDNRPLRGGNQPDRYAANTVAASFDYELDFWGRVRNLVREGRALAQATGGDLAFARLSLQAELAADYLELRGLDAQGALLADTVAAYERALQLTVARHDGGVASGLDVQRATSQLAAARTQISDVAAARVQYEDAIAALVGEAAPAFHIAPARVAGPIPVVPAGLPSTLVERRPDVAAAERRAFAANRAIGVARAAFFPRLSLDALAGFQNTGGPGLFSQGDSFWTLGPQAAQVLLDGGRRHAELAAARAAWTLASADYRAVVLQAFRQVQDGLSSQADYAREAVDSAQAVAAAQATTRLSLIRYRQGATNYLDVVTAQTAELQDEQQALSLDTRRRETAVALVRALGGGWTRADLPTPAQAARLASAGSVTAPQGRP